MTFCLGITVEEGLVAIADTRVVAGNECLVAKKVASYQGPGFSFFIMHSGLRFPARQNTSAL
jgi:putative proteasome-type protease